NQILPVGIVVTPAGMIGRPGWIAHPFDTLSVAVIAFCIYHWGARSGLRSDELALEEDDGE
ncbi:hypothetical protein L2218_17500, partial [Xanthomonas perforans]|nr:hypothetical protein [Xanthomonas perforans]